MDLSSLLKGLSPSVIKLMEEKGIMEIPLEEEGLKALLTYDGEMLNASVFDSEGERYVLFDIDPPGAFVAKLREEVKAKTEEALGIRTPESTLALREKVISLFSERFGISDTYPWKDDNESAVFRSSSNGKWVAIMMKIPLSRLGFSGEKMGYVVNLKHDEERIPLIVDHTHIFPAWHMSKRHWITVVISSGLDWDKFAALVERSIALVEKKR